MSLQFLKKMTDIGCPQCDVQAVGGITVSLHSELAGPVQWNRLWVLLGKVKEPEIVPLLFKKTIYFCDHYPFQSYHMTCAGQYFFSVSK